MVVRITHFEFVGYGQGEGLIKLRVRFMCQYPNPLTLTFSLTLTTVAFSPNSKTELQAAVKQCENKRKRVSWGENIRLL